MLFIERIDPETWDGRYAYAGTAKDGGGWFSLLYESETAEISGMNG